MGTNTELESKVGLSAAALASLLYSHYGQPHSMEVSAHIVKSMGWMCRDDMLLEKLKKDPLVPGDIPSPCPTEAQDEFWAARHSYPLLNDVMLSTSLPVPLDVSFQKQGLGSPPFPSASSAGT